MKRQLILNTINTGSIKDETLLVARKLIVIFLKLIIETLFQN
jgi:hypothetical protein